MTSSLFCVYGDTLLERVQNKDKDSIATLMTNFRCTGLRENLSVYSKLFSTLLIRNTSFPSFEKKN